MKTLNLITIGLIGGILLSSSCKNQGGKNKTETTEEKMEVFKEW